MSHMFHRNTSLSGISIPCQCITSTTFFKLYLICCCSVAQSYLTLCNPMKCSTPGSLFFTISQSLLKLMSIELVMPSNHLTLCHPLLLLPSNFASIRVFSHELVPCIRCQNIGASASVLQINNQDWFPLRLTCLICLQPKGLSRVFSNNTIQKLQFFGSQPSLWSSSHICTWLLGKP